jgi:hypothetical protein
MDEMSILILVLLWIVAFVGTLLWAGAKSRGASIMTWLGLTVVSWSVEFLVAFVALNAIYFSLGREAVIVGFIALGAIVIMTPLAWAYGLNHWNKYRAAHDRAGTGRDA